MLRNHKQDVPSHPIMAWAFRHAAWLLTRFQVRSSSKTAHLFAVWTRVLGSTSSAMKEDLILLERPAGKLQVDAGAARRSDGRSEADGSGL